MKIGTFEKNDNGAFEGRIQTLTFQAELQLLPELEKSKDTAPDFRIIAGDDEIEVGAGWFKKAKSGKSYISCKIDDPVFPNPLWPVLMAENDGEYSLYWDRPSPKTKPVSSEEKELF